MRTWSQLCIWAMTRGRGRYPGHGCTSKVFNSRAPCTWRRGIHSSRRVHLLAWESRGGGGLAIRSCEVYNIHLFGDKLDSAAPPPPHPPTDGNEDPVPLEIPSSQTVMPSQSPRQTAQPPPPFFFLFLSSSSFPSSSTSGFPEEAQKGTCVSTCTVLQLRPQGGSETEREKQLGGGDG